MRIVLDDQQHEILRLQVVAVVRDLLGTRRGQHDRAGTALPSILVMPVCEPRALAVGGAHVVERQVERERAAAARHAREADLTAEQVRKLAADGKTQARAAVLARRAGVGLLERLEDDPLLLGRDADAGIAHGELDHRLRLAQHRVVRAPAACRDPDVQPHAAALGELEGVRQQVLQHLQQALRSR